MMSCAARADEPDASPSFMSVPSRWQQLLRRKAPLSVDDRSDAGERGDAGTPSPPMRRWREAAPSPHDAAAKAPDAKAAATSRAEFAAISVVIDLGPR
jgi:hypothetical protein